MAAPVPPGAPRPGGNNQPQGPPPNYMPNFRANSDGGVLDNLQNLNLNRPPMVSNPFSRPPPFSQPPNFPSSAPSPGFPGSSPQFSRPGPPPGAMVRPAGPPSGPPVSTLPPNVATGRPTGPPPGSQPPPPFGSRPPPNSFPPSLGGGSAAPVSGFPPQGGSPPSRPPPQALGGGARPSPNPFASPQMSAPPGAPSMSGSGNLMSNGPPVFSAGALPGPQRIPPVGSAPQQSVGPPTMRAPPGPAVQPQSPYPMPPQGAVQPPGSPFGAPSWQMQSQQVAPPPPVPGAPQPPRMFGMPPPLPNQSMTTTISPAVGQTGAPMAGPSKIDPNQIPRPTPGSSVILHETRQGNQATIPPPATSDYIVRDTGNCSPRYMRCTINQIPFTADLLTTSGMQLAMLVQPLTLPHPSEEPIQVVDFGESGPVRCSRCKAYINPFMKFIDQGRRFICNLCGFSDETPRDYHCNLGPDGRRRDADERPELCRGTVEFVATKEFMVREPMPAVYFFLIDVSMNAVQTGATAAACSAIKQVITDLPEGPRTRVGVATFDSTIHFYNLKRALQQPLMLIVPDVQDVYTPLQTDVIVPLSECRQHLELLLESIPTMFQNNRTSESAFGAAIKAAFLAMKDTGGKLLVFQSVLPSIGIGALSAREAEGRTNISAGEKEAQKLLQPADKTFKELAVEFAEYQVCVDVFVTTQTYVDMASISAIPRTTGGQVYYYYPFSALSDSAKLYNDLRWNITRPQGFEAVMRLRCSQGIQVQEYYGNFCKRIPTDVDLPGIDCDKTFMVTLKHDDKLQDGSECAFQCALLYTTVHGQRRIRVITLSLPVTSMLSNLFRAADLDTQFCCFLKHAATEVPSKPLPLVREQVTNLCINALFSYRKFCATVSSSGQLILPEALKLLPLYTLALTKSTGLRTEAKIDERSFWINYVSSLSAPLAIPLVYPRMVAIHDLDSKFQEDEESVIPSFLPLSSEHISDDGIYLLENGLDCLIYIGDSVNPDIIRRLFGVATVEEIPTLFVLQQHDNPLSKKLNEVINEIRRQRCSYLRLKLCRKGDPSGMLFFSYIVEDKSAGGFSYVEFLIHVHRQIQNKMAS
ncbi:protein transport protein SEC24 C-like isoform X1 [Lotus japonicus]|nr:protein transport protein SEC24 C-like isoform X1 [Lotus japonicus]